jgi:chromate transporter
MSSHREDMPAPPLEGQGARGSALEVLLVFLKLGLVSFGGPAAHLGYFRAEFVERRRWLDDRGYSDLVALCQFLPGPSSSQIGIGIGLGRAGWLGSLAAWAGFTLPSALAMILFAYGVARWPALAGSGAVHGLKVVAVAVVAQAVLGMGRALCPDVPRALIATLAALVVVMAPAAAGQVAAIAMGGVAGFALRMERVPTAVDHGHRASRRLGALLLAACGILLVGLALLAAASDSLALRAFASFYRSGALVFGGGHVVLPLLQASVVPQGWVSNDAFLAGYGAAQAVPGPLFSFSAYLGAAMPAPLGGWAGGLFLLAAIFLPGYLLVTGALPFWESLRRRTTMRRALAGINAAVVGVLAAALYHPVWTSAIHDWKDLALAIGAFCLLQFGKVSPVIVVPLAAAGGWLLGA